LPRIERTAEIAWEGNLARGSGLISAGSSGAFDELPYSNATRIGQPEGKTSPEELLAAAHGGCFANSLAAELSGAGTPPGSLAVTCKIVMDEVPGEGHQIVGSQLSVRGTVPGADAESFAKAVGLADAGCPFSALLKRSGAEVSVEHELLSG
jgi:osmotically inducible protein OsmC